MSTVRPARLAPPLPFRLTSTSPLLPPLTLDPTPLSFSPLSPSFPHSPASTLSSPSTPTPTTHRRTSPPRSPAPDILAPQTRIGLSLPFFGERLRPVPFPTHPARTPSPDQEPVYEVIRKLGEGSNACVYLVKEIGGEDEEDLLGPMELEHNGWQQEGVRYGREFAVKCLSKKDLTPEQIKMQLQEAKIHQSLAPHPHVVTLHRTLESPSWLLLVLEHVPGEDLFYFLEQARDTAHVERTASSSSADTLRSPSHTSTPPTPIANTPRTPSLLSAHVSGPEKLLAYRRVRLVARMFGQMCAAVAACHAQGVAHRDIKPENFIVTDGTDAVTGERRVVVKLTDFGLATDQEESRDVDCGSAPYMSYECANNIAPTYATRPADVWSLGIVLLNMLYHTNPWTRASPGDCDAYDAFRASPAMFFRDRFPGVTREMAEFLACRVFCTVGERVSARELGEWAMALPGMMREEEGGEGIGMRLGRDKRGSPDAVFGLEHEHDLEVEADMSSREPSIAGGAIRQRGRKRGTRSNKAKGSAPPALEISAAPGEHNVDIVSADSELEPDTSAADMVQALAREISFAGRAGSRSVSRASERTNTTAAEVSASPGKTLRNRPSADNDETWPRGRQSYASSTTSFAPSMSTYNTRYSNGSLRSVSTAATTVSDPLSLRFGGKGFGFGYQQANDNGSVSSFAPSIAGSSYTRLSNPSLRSVATVSDSASIRTVQTAPLAMDKGKGKARDFALPPPPQISGRTPTSARFGSLSPSLTITSTSSSLTNSPRRQQSNVKHIEGMPSELFSGPAGRSPRAPPDPKRNRKQQPDRLDPIVERRGPSSPVFQRRDASTSTTSLDTVDDPAGAAPKKVNKAFLGNLLSGLRRT